MADTPSLLNMFGTLTPFQAKKFAERLREIADTTPDQQLVSAIQAEYEQIRKAGITMEEIEDLQKPKEEWVSWEEMNRRRITGEVPQQQPTAEQLERELTNLTAQARELRRDPVTNRKALQEIDAKLSKTTVTLGQIRSQEAGPARQEAQQAHQGKVSTLHDEARKLMRDPVSNQQRIRQINAELKNLDREQP